MYFNLPTGFLELQLYQSIGELSAKTQGHVVGKSVYGTTSTTECIGVHTEDAFTEASYPFPLYQTSQFPISQVKLG